MPNPAASPTPKAGTRAPGPRAGGATRALVALVAVVALAVPPSPADAAPDPVAAAAAEGHRLAREGGVDDAVAHWLALADAHPGHPAAPGALHDAARVLDRLHQRYEEAVPIYRRLITAYPEHRFARQDAGRLAFVEAGLATGAQALKLYERTRARHAAAGLDASLAAMARLLAEHPDFPYRTDVRVWVAGRLREAGRLEEAATIYRELIERHPGTAVAHGAVAALGQVHVEAGRFEEAVATFEQLYRTHDRHWVFVADDLIPKARERLFRRDLVRGLAVAGVALIVAGLAGVPWRRVRWREVLDVRLELLLYGPAMLWLVALSHGTKDEIFRSLLGVAVGLPPLLALNKLLLEGVQGRRWRLWLQVALIPPALVAFHYLLLYLNDISDMLEHTVAYGPET